MKKLVLIILTLTLTAQVYSQHRFTLMQLKEIASYSNGDEGVRAIREYVGKYGYASSKLYSDNNTFFHQKGNEIRTYQLENKERGGTDFVVIFEIKNPTEKQKNYYKNFLRDYYRTTFKSRSKSSTTYTQNGKYVIAYSDKPEKKIFEVTVYNNTKLLFSNIQSKRINGTKYEITPFVGTLDVRFLKGQNVTLKASGSISLGIFAGSTGPAGKKGFEIYNYVSRFPHGSLLGKFGKNGNWFLVGSYKQITVPQDGLLYLRVNDRDLANNSGKYYLEYTVNGTSTNSTQSTSNCISGNCTNGFGKKKYSNGTYEGQFKNNFRHGRGVYKWNNGESYEGGWVQGKKEGQGTLTFLNGNKYIGAFKNGNREGKGIEYDKNGNVTYDGQWKSDKKTTLISTQQKTSSLTIGCVSGNCTNGYGKYRYNNGIYNGFFKNGKRNGHGHFSWNNGDFYFGNWSNDLRNDYGSYHWKDGSHYVGEWKNNVRTGYGRKKNPKGTYSRGIWQNGKLISAYTFTKNANTTKGCTYGNCTNGYGQLVYENGEKFTGFFINGKRYAGTYRYKNGDLYQGQFGTDDSFTGYGYYLWKNGSYYRGQFKNFKRNGIGYYLNRTDNSEMKGIWANGKLITSH